MIVTSTPSAENMESIITNSYDEPYKAPLDQHLVENTDRMMINDDTAIPANSPTN